MAQCRVKMLSMIRPCNSPKDRHLTYAEIGRRLGISKDRVRQLELRALAKLRRSPVLRQFAREIG